MSKRVKATRNTDFLTKQLQYSITVLNSERLKTKQIYQHKNKIPIFSNSFREWPSFMFSV